MEIDNAKNDEFDIVPSQNKIYKMVKQLIYENEQLKEKVKRLENKVFQKKKKINIIEWLNKQGNNVNNNIYKNYETFLKNIKLKDSLQHIFHNSYINGYFSIIKHLLKENILLCFQQKRQIYYYNESWYAFKVSDLKNFTSKIQRNLICELFEKKEEISNEKFIDVTSNILGGGGEERDFKNVKLYKKIWEYISEDVEKHLEYNIIF
tara:strand:+ start:10584 stop:11204 length:621 start_codon:yes stop_codon:yes gene_type:complete